MQNARIQKTVANARVRNTLPNSRAYNYSQVHAKLRSPFVNSHIDETNVDRVTTITTTGGGSPIGLLLALTYTIITSTTTVVKGGYGPHARIR